MKTETAISLISFLAALWSVYKSHQSNKIAEESNKIAKEANATAVQQSNYEFKPRIELQLKNSTTTFSNGRFTTSPSLIVSNKGLKPIDFDFIAIEHGTSNGNKEKMVLGKACSIKEGGEEHFPFSLYGETPYEAKAELQFQDPRNGELVQISKHLMKFEGQSILVNND